MARTKRNQQRWIQSAIRRPGRTRAYIRRLFGEKGFTKDGKIKMSALEKAIQKVKNSKMPKDRKRSLLSALYLALRLRRMHR